MSDSLQPHGLLPTRLLCPWDSPGKKTGVSCHILLQRIFPTQGLNPPLLNCRQILYHLNHQGNPQFSLGSRNSSPFPLLGCWGVRPKVPLSTSPAIEQEGHALIFSCENTRITTSFWITIDKRILRPTKKKIPYIQEQRRIHKMVGGVQSRLKSNLIPTRDPRKVQTNLVHNSRK